MNRGTWTRRQFGQAAAAIAGAAVAARAGVASWAMAPQGLTFVGSGRSAVPGSGSIHVFRTMGERWTELGTVAAAAPVHLLLHPTLPVLYAVHNVDTWDHLPRGAVSAYCVDRTTGRLDLMASQPLSLSATRPRHAVLSAGASHLFVAAEGGGIYNLLPVAGDGTLRPASAIRKEFGLDDAGTTKLAAPNSVALLPCGALLAADAGQETLSTFRVDGGALVLQHRSRVHHGEGPAGLSLSADGSRAFTRGAVSGTVRQHRLVAGRAMGEVVLGPQPSPLAPALAHVADAISLLQV